jgi:NADH pyrophosphatase NudC (nudix superfamily)
MLKWQKKQRNILRMLNKTMKPSPSNIALEISTSHPTQMMHRIQLRILQKHPNHYLNQPRHLQTKKLAMKFEENDRMQLPSPFSINSVPKFCNQNTIERVAKKNYLLEFERHHRFCNHCQCTMSAVCKPAQHSSPLETATHGWVTQKSQSPLCK